MRPHGFTCAKANVQAQRKSLLALYWGYLDHKLMDLPHDLAVKPLLLEQTCDFDWQFRK